MTDYTALYAKLLAQKCTSEEAQLLLTHFATDEGDADLIKWVNAAMDRPVDPLFSAVDEEHIRQTELRLMKIIEPEARIFQLRWAYGAAAAMIAVFFIWFYTGNSNDAPITYANDVTPGKNAATLTLANGRKILINDATTGSIARQAGIKISKTADGQIIYEPEGTTTGTEGYNTLSTSTGEQFQVRLSDGTLVFLNAGSSLQYPVSFTGNAERVLNLKGEAYFEVAKDVRHPFILKTHTQHIQVLGTHFNVSAYENESSTRTTLVEGAVTVSLKAAQTNRDVTVRLSPGKEAVNTGKSIIVQIADVEEATSWKDGYFRFNDDQIGDIMKKISRWYGIDVVYEGEVTDQGFTGTISKKSNISQVLAMLEATKLIHFKIEGRRVTVLN